MAKRRAKRTVKEVPASAERKVEDDDKKGSQTEENEEGLIDQEGILVLQSHFHM